MRKLKYAEKKLLKRTDFFDWKVDNNLHEVQIMRRYYIQKREDYTFYNKLARKIRDTAGKIKNLEVKDPVRVEASGQLIAKLYAVGIIPTSWNLEMCAKVNASSFCRRRLPVLMVYSKMVPNLKTAVTYIEHGHVRVGAEVVKDPAFLVTRALEDFITWTDGSAIRKHISQYNEARDDFVLDKC